MSNIQSPNGRRLGDVIRDSAGLDPETCLRLERTLFSQPGKAAGQALVESSVVSLREVEEALHLQVRERMEALYALEDARLRFRVASPKELESSLRLPAAEFLHGRLRKRQVRRTPARQWQVGTAQLTEEQAFALLGLEPGAERASVRAAFRRRAAAVHPDRYLGTDETRRQALQVEFVRLSAAYRRLVA